METTLLEQYRSAIGCDIADLKKEIAIALGPAFKVESRIKSLEGIEAKMSLKQHSSVLEVRDVYGFRVLADSTKNCYRAKDIILQKFKSSVLNDYIVHAKLWPNSLRLCYMAIQMTLWHNNCMTDIQVTTPDMQKMNDESHAFHKQIRYGVAK